jgi:hypothetical protein
MRRVQIGGAGGAPSNNVIRSLRHADERYYLIGHCATPSDLFLADVDERHVVPSGNDPAYNDRLLRLLAQTRPDFLHVQNDVEVRAVSRIRDRIEAAGVRLFLPAAQTVEDCVDKLASYRIWERAGVRTPRTLPIGNPDDLQAAFSTLGPKVWIRAAEGAGGRGALPTEDFEFARRWIDRYHGWGSFTASECLTADTVTWLSIWYRGELVVAQTRKRHRWNFGSRAPSGVTGITGVGETCSDEGVTQLALDAIAAVDGKPHGVFGVDMTYDTAHLPYVTEINIARFFTTCYFFTAAGLNMPQIYCDLAFDQRFPTLQRTINPLPDGLVWIRGMDVEPVLTTAAELAKLEQVAAKA